MVVEVESTVAAGGPDNCTVIGGRTSRQGYRAVGTNHPVNSGINIGSFVHFYAAHFEGVATVFGEMEGKNIEFANGIPCVVYLAAPGGVGGSINYFEIGIGRVSQCGSNGVENVPGE